MNKTQFLIFEISDRCNLGFLHGACPNTSANRWNLLDATDTLTDDEILSIAEQMHTRYGFRGWVGWHYYNEPLLSRDRLFPLMRRMRETIPQVRFALWTNGVYLDKCATEDLALFDRCHITEYYPVDWDRWEKLFRVVERIPVAFDDRMTQSRQYDYQHCLRMFFEFIIDYHGNIHPCCYDWQGHGTVGNVLRRPLSLLVSRWINMRNMLLGEMSPDAPQFCQECSRRYRVINSLDSEIGTAAAEFGTEFIRQRCLQPI